MSLLIVPETELENNEVDVFSVILLEESVILKRYKLTEDQHCQSPSPMPDPEIHMN